MSGPAPEFGNGRLGDGWEGAAEFKSCVRAWAEKIGVKPARIQLQPMTKKWASCSPGGVVTFSIDLLGQDRSFGETVIVHELLHLKVPNHGPVFKSLLNAYLPHGDVHATAPERRVSRM
jgi:predicted metal-dependent hydrolase